MNIDKFEMDTVPFEKTLTLRLPSTAMMDEEAAQALSEWNSPLIYSLNAWAASSIIFTTILPAAFLFAAS